MPNRGTYQFNSIFYDVLWVDNGGQGLDSVLRPIQDGAGNNTILTISTNAFNIETSGGGSFTINGDTFVNNTTASYITATANAGFINERILTAGNNITVADGGAGGNFVVNLQDNPVMTGTEGFTLPAGTTAERPVAPNTFEMRGNTDLTDIEAYVSGSWINILTGSSGAPINATYITQTSDGTLTNEQALGSLATGILASTTATGVVNSCTLTGTTNQITVTNGTGVGGNPTFSLPSAVIVSTSLQAGNLELSGNTLESTNLNGNVILSPVGNGSIVLAPQGSGVVALQSPIVAVVPLRFYEDSGVNYVAFQAPATLGGDVTWTLPTTDSTGTQALVSDGAGVLSWQTLTTGTVTSVTGTANQIDVATGTTTPVISISPTYVGQTSITTLGTIGTGTWNATNIALNKGGTNAALTASNGGIFYSTATAGAILAGTATANQVLLSGSTAAPAWSAATYPSTTTINQLLYSSAADVISGLATANNGMLVTGNTGVPSISALTAGQVFIGTTGAAPTAATLTAGSGVSITSASGSITISSSFAGNWVDQTTSATMAVNTNYIANAAGLVTLTLPAVAPLGSVFQIVGKGTGGWTLAQAVGQQINFGTSTTTSGVGGSLASTNTNDCVSLVCVTANTNFVVMSSVGNLTVV